MRMTEKRAIKILEDRFNTTFDDHDSFDAGFISGLMHTPDRDIEGKMKALQVGLKGFTNPENEDQVDESKNIWIVCPEDYVVPEIANIVEVSDLPKDFIGKSNGIDYFLPQDEEAFLEHIQITECKYK